MALYQYIFLDDHGRSPALDVVDCDGDGPATCKAAALLGQHGSCCAVEVYDGDRLVVRLNRPVDLMFAAGTSLHGTG